MQIPHQRRRLRSKSAATSTPRSKPIGLKRSGDVLDSLVVMIAGLLLPAWLLGHLFLTFYPAPEVAVENTAAESEIAAVSKSSFERNENDAQNLQTSDSLNGSNANTAGTADTESTDEFKLQLAAMTQRFQSLTATSTTLESENASLKQTNTTLADENAALKAQVSAMPRNVAPDTDRSAEITELQTRFDSVSTQLETTKQDLVDATSRLETAANEKQTLRAQLSNATSELEKARADLTAAVAKNESDMEIKPDSDSTGSPFALLAPDNDEPDPDLAADANAKAAELEQEVMSLRAKLNDTSDALDAQKAELRAAQMQLQTLTTKNGDLENALDAAREKAAQTELPKEEFRDFVSSKGNVSKMAFIRWEGEAVIVRSFANKKLYRLTMDRFSEADKQFLLDQKR